MHFLTFHSLQALFTLYNFHFPLTVALLQMAVIAPVCYIVAKPKLDWTLARAFIPLSIVNVLNVISGLMGKYLSALPYPKFAASHTALIQQHLILYPHPPYKSADLP